LKTRYVQNKTCGRCPITYILNLFQNIILESVIIKHFRVFPTNFKGKKE
jgi:hypothetical protein